MKERHPEHYAMTFLGFVIGARPSNLRPLRRSGPEGDVLLSLATLMGPPIARVMGPGEDSSNRPAVMP